MKKAFNDLKFLAVLISLLLTVCFIIGVLTLYNCALSQKLINAIECNDVATLRELMKAPFKNLDSKPAIWIYEVMSEQNNSTPLQAACNAGNFEIVDLLLKNGADVNYTHWDKTRDQGPPLSNAAGTQSNDRLQVIKLLIESGADVDYENHSGNDALSCLVYNVTNEKDTIETIEYLEQYGADINKKYSMTQNTLLHKACEVDNFLVIRYLIERRGFDINQMNADGDTPIITFVRFASKRNMETLKFLIENGADLQAKNKEGKSAYDYAVERHPEFVDLLRGQAGQGTVLCLDGVSENKN